MIIFSFDTRISVEYPVACSSLVLPLSS